MWSFANAFLRGWKVVDLKDHEQGSRTWNENSINLRSKELLAVHGRTEVARLTFLADLCRHPTI